MTQPPPSILWPTFKQTRVSSMDLNQAKLRVSDALVRFESEFSGAGLTASRMFDVLVDRRTYCYCRPMDRFMVVDARQSAHDEQSMLCLYDQRIASTYGSQLRAEDIESMLSNAAMIRLCTLDRARSFFHHILNMANLSPREHLAFLGHVGQWHLGFLEMMGSAAGEEKPHPGDAA